jgi:hypothetical protein
VNQDVTGAGVITAFHKRRVLSLMRRACLLDEMVPNAPLEGTVLMMEDLDRKEIKKRIKLALGSVPSDVALDLYLLMCNIQSWHIRPRPTLPRSGLTYVATRLSFHPRFAQNG